MSNKQQAIGQTSDRFDHRRIGASLDVNAPFTIIG